MQLLSPKIKNMQETYQTIEEHFDVKSKYSKAA